MFPDADLTGRQVLVAEDEAAIGLFLLDELAMLGLSVAGPFTRCAAALDWLAEHTPDLALLDVKLGDGPCMSLAQELRRRGVSFAFFSGGGDDDERLRREFPGVPWIGKPAPLEQIVGALRQSVSLSGG